MGDKVGRRQRCHHPTMVGICPVDRQGEMRHQGEWETTSFRASEEGCVGHGSFASLRMTPGG